MKNTNGEPVLSAASVRVYRNLWENCWSIQRKTSKGWRVWLRWDYVVLDNVDFIVNKAGQDRVRKENKKYVHAFAQGTLMANTLGPSERMIRVNYNPYDNDFFQTRHGDLHQAQRVWLTNKGEVFCEGITN
jgi:hypothetical protein